MLIALAGLPASGKSTLARRLRDALPAVLLDKDVLRSFLFATRVDYSAGQNDLVMDIAYQVSEYLHRQDPDIKVLIDGRTFSESHQVATLKQVACRLGTPLHFIECVCSEQTARERLQADLAEHPAKDRDFDLYLRRRASADPLREPKLLLDTDAQSLDACVQQALAWLANPATDKAEATGSGGPADAGDIIVIDLGGTKTRLGSVRNGQPFAHFQTLDSQHFNGANPDAALADAIGAYASEHALRPIAAVAGIPGIIDPVLDTISHCNNIPALEGQGLRSQLEQRLGYPVHFQQDIMLQVLGEYRAGVATDRQSVVGVYFGTGIGCTWLQQGNASSSPAVCLQGGHIPFPGAGLVCGCGNSDCVEACASGHTLRALAESRNLPVASIFTRRNDPELDQALHRFVHHQACLLATIVTLIAPDLIVIGGGIPLMPGYPRDTLIATARDHLQKPWPANRDCFAFARLGEQAPLHGALAVLEAAGRAPRTTPTG